MSAYLKFFQLEKSPFDTRAQSALVLGTKALRSAFGEIEQGLADGAPRICVDGKAGLGKTSLARALPKLLGETARVVLILNPSLPWSTLRSAIVKQLDLAEGNLSRKTLMRARAEGRRLVIAIDQAERISGESLDHLDILLGYKTDDDEQLLHCVLLANLEAAASQHDGQGEQMPLLWWLDRLNTLQLEFQPIPPDGVASYVLKHLKRAGWKRGQIFTPDALQTIHRLTGGVPREMSDLCERALELAAEEQTDCIDAQLVEDVFGEIPLEELVDGDEDDVTDSAFVGAKDDHASATTATFGGDSLPRDPEPPPFVRPPGDAQRPPTPAATTPAAASDDPRVDPVPPQASDDPRVDPVPPQASDDPRVDPVPAPGADEARIDRMPAPGRTVHAPVAAPISLDSFFGDAPPRPAPRPETHAETEASDEPERIQDGLAIGADAAGATRGRGLVRFAVAATVVLIAGAGGYAALTLLGGEPGGDARAPEVVARPKGAPGAAAKPIAGHEPIVAGARTGTAADPADSDGERLASGPRGVSPTATGLALATALADEDGLLSAVADDVEPPAPIEPQPLVVAPEASAAAGANAAAGASAAAGANAAAGSSAAAPTSAPAGSSASTPASIENAADPLLGLDEIGTDPLEPGPPPATAALATSEPAAADTAETAPPASPARSANPADAQVDAPFW